MILEDASVERLALRDEPGGVEVLQLVLIQVTLWRASYEDDHHQHDGQPAKDGDPHPRPVPLLSIRCDMRSVATYSDRFR